MFASSATRFVSRSTPRLARLALSTAATKVSSAPILGVPKATFNAEIRPSFSTAPPAAKMNTVEEHEYEIVTKDKTNLWDQLRELINTQRWTTQDHATLSLLQEQENVISLFIVRKADNYLLGAVILIETNEIVYGNVYVMREGYRASGMGMKLMKTMMQVLAEPFSKKPFMARGVTAMMGKYAGPPFYATHLYELFSYEFKDKKDILDFFPAPASHPYNIVSVKDLTPRQFQKLVDYDKKVTGVDRTKFLQDYYSIDFVQGVILFDSNGEIRGQAGLVPTSYEKGLYKLNPIYAESKDDACTLVHAMVAKAPGDDAHFVLHSRTESAGDWILKKCKDQGRKLYLVGALCNATNMNQIYKDRSNTQLIHAPTNSPAHFDG